MASSASGVKKAGFPRQRSSNSRPVIPLSSQCARITTRLLPGIRHALLFFLCNVEPQTGVHAALRSVRRPGDRGIAQDSDRLAPGIRRRAGPCRDGVPAFPVPPADPETPASRASSSQPKRSASPRRVCSTIGWKATALHMPSIGFPPSKSMSGNRPTPPPTATNKTVPHPEPAQNNPNPRSQTPYPIWIPPCFPATIASFPGLHRYIHWHTGSFRHVSHYLP